VKHLLLLPVLLAVITLAPARARAGAGAGDQAADKAIHQRHDEWCAAWNKHDPKAMAAFFFPDGDLINPFGRTCKGAAEIEKLFTEEQSGPMAGTSYSGTIQSIRYFGDIAIVDVAGEITGMKTPEGTPAPPFKHHVTWIAEKKDGQWLAHGARAFITLPAPPAPAAPPEAPAPPADQ
jgi:uncharacterized protein (TIGR02246 family)